MKTLSNLKLLTGIIVAFTLTACGMGGGETGTGFDAPPVAHGKITGFGSVYVNGIKFNTTNSRVFVGGEETPETSLRIGMIVTISGSINQDGVNGTAQKINYEKELQGSVQNISTDTATGKVTLTVAGQTVIVDAGTIIEGTTSAASIANNAFIEVSGFISSNGVITASYLQVKDVSGVTEIKGSVKNLSVDRNSFNIGTTTVHITSNTRLSDVSTLSNDLFVEVKGSFDLQQNVLHATSIELKSRGFVDANKYEGFEIKIDGQITAVSPNANEIEVNGQTIKITAETEGETSGFQLGQLVFVEARMSAGNLVAEEIKTRVIEFSKSNEVKAAVTSVNATNLSVNIAGIDYFVDARTVMKDELNDERLFNIGTLDKIRQGDWVELHYFIDASGKYIATELKRISNETSETGDSQSGSGSSKNGSSDDPPEIETHL